MASPLNITAIPSSRQRIINSDGTPDSTWYRWFNNQYLLTGGGSNPTSLTDLQVGPDITTAEDPTGTQALQEVGTLPPPQDMQSVYDALQALAVGPTTAGGSLTSITAGTGITVSPDPITTTGTVSLADTKVTPGSYTLLSADIDQQGRITKAANGTAVTKVATGTGLTGGPITTTGTVSVDTASTLTWTKAQTFDQLITSATKFASLPGSPVAGQRSFITDASATTFASKAAGGGANAVPVTYDGSDWIIG